MQTLQRGLELLFCDVDGEASAVTLAASSEVLSVADEDEAAAMLEIFVGRPPLVATDSPSRLSLSADGLIASLPLGINEQLLLFELKVPVVLSLAFPPINFTNDNLKLL